MDKEKYILNVQNLSFGYGNDKLFDHLNVQIKDKKITTLIGSNGCGKSTLFQLMTGNLKPEAGTIQFKDKSLDAYRLRDLAKVMAIVQQTNTAPDDITVEKLVSYGRIPYHSFGSRMSEEDEKIIANAMNITGIYELRKCQINQLSGGQRQRVFIAMAIAQDTDVIFLDEPTTYLDIRYQLEILDLVKRLNIEHDITIIMVLHDINQACSYSDEIIAINQNGEIVEQGDPKCVIDSMLLENIYGVRLDIIDHNDRKIVITS